MPQFASKISSLEVYKIINYLFADEKRGKSTEPNTEVRRCKRNYKCVGFAKPPSSANEADDININQIILMSKKNSFHLINPYQFVFLFVYFQLLRLVFSYFCQSVCFIL